MKPYTRRTPQQWQTLIEQWHDSGLSAARFCEEQAVGYASFCHWRRRLADRPSGDRDEPHMDEGAFFDLAALTHGNVASGWSIVLSLGEGIELRLSRP